MRKHAISVGAVSEWTWFRQRSTLNKHLYIFDVAQVQLTKTTRGLRIWCALRLGLISVKLLTCTKAARLTKALCAFAKGGKQQ